MIQNDPFLYSPKDIIKFVNKMYLGFGEVESLPDTIDRQIRHQEYIIRLTKKDKLKKSHERHLKHLLEFKKTYDKFYNSFPDDV